MQRLVFGEKLVARFAELRVVLDAAVDRAHQPALRLVLGTDYPFPWNTDPVDHILSIPDITDADKIKILGATAAKLLGIEH